MADSLWLRFEATEAKVSRKRYVVVLSAGDRKRLKELIRKGNSPAKKQLKARILLAADQGPLGPKWNDRQISEALGTSPMRCARGVKPQATCNAVRSADLRWRERS